MIGFFPPPPRPLRPVRGFAVVVLVALAVDALLPVPTPAAAVLAAAVVLRITRLQEGVSARVSGFSPYQ